MPAYRARAMNSTLKTQPMRNRMMNAGMDAIDHFTMKPTIDQNGMCKSVTITVLGNSFRSSTVIMTLPRLP